jgi:cytochrome c biogenesis protein CcmG/thiol:disulfide interchange protein DsbE
VRTPGEPVAVPGDGPAVVNFFASWCVPCREELPELQRVHERWGDEVRVVGVDVADNRRKAVALLDRTGARFPAGYDPDKAVAGRYALNGMPTTVFVDEEGRIVGRVQGKVTRATLDQWVERLLADEEAA